MNEVVRLLKEGFIIGMLEMERIGREGRLGEGNKGNWMTTRDGKDMETNWVKQRKWKWRQKEKKNCLSGRDWVKRSDSLYPELSSCRTLPWHDLNITSQTDVLLSFACRCCWCCCFCWGRYALRLMSISISLQASLLDCLNLFLIFFKPHRRSLHQ